MSSMISVEHKLLFVHIPRTGGSSIAYSLTDVWGAPPSHTPTHRKVEDFDVDPADYFKFCSIRNPWDMCVSFVGWHDLNSRDSGMTIEIAAEMVWPATKFGIEEMDTVLRFESLPQDFPGFCLGRGLEPRPLKHMSKTIHRDYQMYYTPAVKARVAERFAYEIERFGYEF